MSNPFLTPKRPIQDAIREVISGLSALNMRPAPLKAGADAAEVMKAYKADPNGLEFLPDLDHWVGHAWEHFQAAIAILQRASLIEQNLSFIYESIKGLDPLFPEQRSQNN